MAISIRTGGKRKMLTGAVALGMAAAAGAAPLDRDQAAEVRALNRALLSRPSATETLTRWCADHHLAKDPTVVAVLDPTATNPPDAETFALLGEPGPTMVKHRRVALTCGTRVLSEADNWYRPDRLTPAMNAALDASRTPFGLVVKPLGFTRKTLSVKILNDRTGAVLRHRALLTTSDGKPFSVVVETYTRDVLGDLEPK